MDEPHVYYSSGLQVHLTNATRVFAAYANTPGAQFRAYSGVARGAEHKATFGTGLHIALLHYVTKDVRNFIAKRADRPVNWPTRPAQLADRPFTEPAVMEAFEKDMKYDGSHAVCGEAARLDYAGRSARAWHARA